MEEERRLLYVAITRAEKHCMLTYAKNRWRYGKMEMFSKSRFLNDIDPALLETDEDQFLFGEFSTRTPVHPRGIHTTHNVSTERSRVMPQRPELNRPLTRMSAAVAKPTSASKTSASASSSNLCEGMVIEHQRFGRGTITKIEGAGENMKATVEFVHTGIKQLLLKFAKFTVIK